MDISILGMYNLGDSLNSINQEHIIKVSSIIQFIDNYNEFKSKCDACS